MRQKPGDILSLFTRLIYDLKSKPLQAEDRQTKKEADAQTGPKDQCLKNLSSLREGPYAGIIQRGLLQHLLNTRSTSVPGGK